MHHSAAALKMGHFQSKYFTVDEKDKNFTFRFH